MFRNGEILIII